MNPWRTFALFKHFAERRFCLLLVTPVTCSRAFVLHSYDHIV